ncbi:MAG: OmpA family protein [Bacteroidales bacterium]
MALYNVFFETDSWELLDESIIELTRLFELLLLNRSVVVEIGGHTDSSGSDEHNILLSEQRTMAVKISWPLRESILPG